MLVLVMQSVIILAQVDNEFWFVVPEITYRHNSTKGEPTVFRIASLGDSVLITISMPARGITLDQFVMKGGSYAEYDITPLIRDDYVSGDYLLNLVGTNNESNTIESGLPNTEGIVSDRGILITSKPFNVLKGDDRITVYLDRFNPNNQDIWSLKGNNGLGTDFTIISQNYAPNRNTYVSKPDGWALNAFDIVATKDNTTVTITPVADIKNQIPADGYVYAAGVSFDVDLNAGETFSCVANGIEITDHLGGSIVTSNEDIAITLKDDSMHPSGAGVDTGGDQLIPDALGGWEYVVMRGQLTITEYAFVMALEDGDTDVTYNTDVPSTVPITLTGRGDIQKIPMNAAAGNDIDALYLNADQKIMVWHITGFGNEMGGALIPSIDLCTGSNDVTVVRSAADDNYYLNLMTKQEYIDDFIISMDLDGNDTIETDEEFPLLATDFEQAGTSDWWFLKKSKNNFSNDAISPISQQAIANLPLKIVNPGRFHLGTIGGGSSGCKYGYFSSFAVDDGGSDFDDDDQSLNQGTYCYGDTIFVSATGGDEYNWWFAPSQVPADYEILGGTDTTANLVMIVRPPTGYYDGSVNVSITRECVVTGPPVLEFDNAFFVLPKIVPDFDTTLLDDNLCSPARYQIEHVNESFSTNSWTFENALDTITETETCGSSPNPYNRVIEFENYGLSTAYYDVKHVLRWNGVGCSDSVSKTIKIQPQVIAKSSSVKTDGCAQFISVAFDPSATPPTYTAAHYNWGDGNIGVAFDTTGRDSTHYHTFWNGNINDTTYYPKLIVVNDTCACYDTIDEAPVFVPGKIIAQYAIEYQGSDKCSPLNVKYTNDTRGNVNYKWWFYEGNDTTNVAPDYLSSFTDTTIEYTNTSNVPDTFYVALRVEQNGTVCFDEYGIDTIIVFPEPTVTINPAASVTICNGDSVDFSSLISPIGLAAGYHWNFGNGSSSVASPGFHAYNHQENTLQTYPVSLLVTSDYGGCDDTVYTSIDVASYIDASFTVLPDTSGCAPLSVAVTNNSSVNSLRDFTWTDVGNDGDAPDDNATFNVLYNNITTGTDQTYTIILENENPEGCIVSHEQEILVHPEITAEIAPVANLTICNGDSITFNNASFFTGILTPIDATTPGAEFSWIVDGISRSANEDFKYIFNNTENNGIISQQFIVELAIAINGCVNIDTVYVEVYPEVTPQFNSTDYTVCSPLDVLITNSSVGADTYEWQFSDGTPNVTTEHVTHTFTTLTANAIDNVTVTLEATNDMCVSTLTKNYTVYPELIPLVAPDVTADCGPLTVVFTNNSTGGVLANDDLLAVWDFDDGTPVLNNTDPTVTYTFSNKSNVDVTRDVKLIVSNGAGCSDSVSVAITIFPEVEANFTYVKISECSPMDVTIENTSLNGSNFEWDFGFAGETAVTNDHSDVIQNFYHTHFDANTKDIYTITLVASDAAHPTCTDTKTKPITIYPPVVSDFSISNDAGCSPLVSGLDNASTGYNLRYVWDYGDDNTSSNANANHTHEFRNFSTANLVYQVTLVAIDSLGCSETHSENVSVDPEVVADFTFTKDAVCTPFPVTFSYPETAINGTRWEWDFGESNDTIDLAKQSFTHVFDNLLPNTVSSYTITLRAIDVATTCDNTITKNIEVYPRLVPQFDADQIEGCNALDVQFTNESTGLATYSWDFKDGQSSSLVSPEHNFSHLSAIDEDYEVLLSANQENTGCTKTVDTVVTVWSYVNASFGLAKVVNAKGSKSAIVGGCHPFTVEITDSSQTDGAWAWDFGDGETGVVQQPGNRIYYNTDQTSPIENETYEVQLVVTNARGCIDTESAFLEVYPRSLPSFSVDLQGCHPHATSFVDESVTDAGTKYHWSLGDGSTKVEDSFDYTYLNYSYTDVAEFDVTLKTTTSLGCEDDTTQTVTVYPKPLADLIPVIDRSCPPFNAELVNESVAENSEYVWNFGDGTPEESRTTLTTEQHTYYNNSMIDEVALFVPRLIVTTEYACVDTIDVTLFTFPSVLVGFEPSTDTGCSPLTVDFTNNSNPSAKIFDWQFGDGASSGLKRPTHIYYNETSVDQTLIVSLNAESEHGCKDSLTDTILVYLTPVVDFDANEPVQIYPDDSILFTNLTQPGPWSFEWDFGDGSPLSNTDELSFHYAYGTWGANEDGNIFEVTLRSASEHCFGQKVKEVKILPAVPELKIEQVTPGNGCVPLAVSFEISQQYSNSFLWEFGDGETSTEAEPVYTFEEPGVYNVKLTAEGDGGVNIDYSIVTVYPLPEPDFLVTPELVMLPDQEIQLYNLTVNGHTYEWDFGDGESGVGESPTHLYTEEGDYNITLVAYSEFSCVNTIVKEAAAHVNGEGFIEYPNAFMPNENSPTDGSYSIPDIDNIVFHPIFEGINNYEMWIFNRWGEQIFYSDDINVGWNGKFGNDGKELGQDVYFWKAKGDFQNGVPYKKAGDLTLIIK